MTSVLEIDPRSDASDRVDRHLGRVHRPASRGSRRRVERYEHAVERRRELPNSSRRGGRRPAPAATRSGRPPVAPTGERRTRSGRRCARLSACSSGTSCPRSPSSPGSSGSRSTREIAPVTRCSARDAVVERGSFRLGPITLDLVPGERLAVTGANGTGKTTLLHALLGELPLASGRRRVGGRRASARSARNEAAYAGDACTARRVRGANRARSRAGEDAAREVRARRGARRRGVVLALSGRADARPDSRSCRRCASTCSCSTSPRTTSTWRRSSSSSPRSPATTGRSSSSPTTVASSNARTDEENRRLAILRSRSWPSPSVRRRGRGATSDAHSTGSPSRASSSARRASSPSAPHRVCPNCKTYKGRDVEPIRLEAP